MEKKKSNSPITFIGAWVVLMLILFPVLLITGSATQLLTNIVVIPVVVLSGAALIAISIPLLFNHWYKSNKWLSILLIIATALPLLYFLFS